MKLPLKKDDPVGHVKRRTIGRVLEVFSDGDAWVRWNGGYECLVAGRDLKKLRNQGREAV